MEPGWVMCDLVAVVAALEPSIVTEQQALHCQVNCSEGPFQGALGFDWYNRHSNGNPTNVSLVKALDRGAYLDRVKQFCAQE